MKLSFKKTYLLFFAILAVSVILRFWQLGKVPISPDWDEVALGYNAYSIIHTGRDEFGKFLPVVLRSFDDYKPALYMYLAIPSVFIFGLNVFAVRFPAAFFGVIGVLTTFFLIRELFKEYKYRDILALLSSFLLAISPWDIQFSRIGFESHIGDVFNVLGLLFFLKGLKKPWLLFVSALLFGLNIYVYQSEKVFTPLLVFILIAIYFKDFIKIPKKFIIGFFVLAIVIVLPMFLYINSNKEALLRVTGTSVFSDQTQLLKSDIQKLEIDQVNNDKIGQILDNRRIVYFKTIADGYLSHFNFNWLFIRGDLARHHAPNMGLLYLWEFPFILIGIYSLFFSKFNKKTKLLIFGWLLIVPIPASVTSGVPHAVRTMNFIPLYEIFTALGLVSFFISIDRKAFFKKISYSILILFAIFNFIYYLNQYFVQQNYFTALDWQYGWEPAVDYVKDVESKYDKIIVTDKQPLDRSYMFFAFYLRYPPDKYQKETQNQSGGFAEIHSFSKFEFRPIDWAKDSQEKKTLLIGRPGDFPSTVSVVKTIDYPNGRPAIKIVEN